MTSQHDGGFNPAESAGPRQSLGTWLLPRRRSGGRSTRPLLFRVSKMELAPPPDSPPCQPSVLSWTTGVRVVVSEERDGADAVSGVRVW